VGPDLHPRFSVALCSRETCRRRNHVRAHHHPPSTCQFRRSADNHKDPSLPYELYGEQRFDQLLLQEDGPAPGYVDSLLTLNFAKPASVALLSSGPEVQYVALRNILLIIQRRPIVLKNDVKVFFCKYNDPIYVKLAKLEIMYRLARAENYTEVLAELHE
jgi:Adaptin N terminal region